MTIEELENIISMRANASPDQSWTARLLEKGSVKVAEKFGEESIEAVIEAVRNDRERLIAESADVLYHLLVMLHSQSIGISDVMEELDRRHMQSGIMEKASRKQQPGK
ncbi:MAG: phosphoribosyl-ATP diphosphatase [Roseovarius sp.]|nr:phosphoribosyl-ATP diphosphatase [Roseovarius sp.]MCY4317067.1 phosphoribosyl-ATP diphosphatase [Roseovarius sp.]